MNDTIQVWDKQFRKYIPEAEIQAVVRRVASDMTRDYRGRSPLVCPVLTGSCMFAADLVRALDIDVQLSFVRYASYEGTASTGTVRELLGFPESCRGRDVIIVEDIVDSGVSMEHMLARLAERKPASVAVCTLFFKPGSFRKDFPIDYIGMKIADEFILGYGLDYNGMGRTYRDIYILDN